MSLVFACSKKERNVCYTTFVSVLTPVIPLDHYSSFTYLQHVATWIFRFVNYCCHICTSIDSLTVTEMYTTERYCLCTLHRSWNIKSGGSVYTLSDQFWTMMNHWEKVAEWVRAHLSEVIIHHKHPITKLLIMAEHLCTLHAEVTLLSSIITDRFHILFMKED